MGRKKRRKSSIDNNPRTSAMALLYEERQRRQQIQKQQQHWQQELQYQSSQNKNKPAEKPNQETAMSGTRKVKQVKEFNGVVSCIFEHEVVKTTACYEWTGPKISREAWNEMLAFFRWTFNTSKSESQVRLFANHLTKEWAIWAFPQTEGTGMTTKEIENDDSKLQRAQFPDSAGWFYYGTVHHHCMASAFQSSVDEHNEKSQDGLHITVGKINSEQFDIDARVYQSGYKLVDFDITEFWDVGNITEGIPPQILKMLPDDYDRRMALLQMGTPPPQDQTFPDLWKTNVIREVRVTSMPVANSYYNGVYSGPVTYNKRCFAERAQIQTDFDAKRFASDILEYMRRAPDAAPIGISAIRDSLKTIDTFVDLEDLNVLDLMLRNDMKFEMALATLDKIENTMKEMELEKELEEKTRPKSKVKQLKNPTAASLTTAEDSHGTMDYEGPNYGGHYPGYGNGYGMGG